MPHRSKAFLAFVHTARRDGLCVACESRTWSQLHHFGSDGGAGLKPSDYLVVRLCRECHADSVSGRKILAMRRDGFDQMAADYLADAADSLSLWSAHLESRLAESEANGCARDELVTWLMDYDATDLAGAEAWLLAWAHRRHANALEGFCEALGEVVKADSLEGARFTADRALKAWLPGQT